MHAQPKKWRKPQQRVKAVSHTTLQKVEDKLHQLKDFLLKVNTRLLPRQPLRKYEEPLHQMYPTMIDSPQ